MKILLAFALGLGLAPALASVSAAAPVQAVASALHRMLHRNPSRIGLGEYRRAGRGPVPASPRVAAMVAMSGRKAPVRRALMRAAQSPCQCAAPACSVSVRPTPAASLSTVSGP